MNIKAAFKKLTMSWDCNTFEFDVTYNRKKYKVEAKQFNFNSLDYKNCIIGAYRKGKLLHHDDLVRCQIIQFIEDQWKDLLPILKVIDYNI